jgi:hypothetical protein
MICIDVATLKSYYISTRTCRKNRITPAGNVGKMQDKQTTGLFLGIFMVVGILSILAVIAIPHAGQMTAKSRHAAREQEYYTIKIAVTEMLNDSAAGTLIPVGPITDMSKVYTSDAEPLVLTDYLNSAYSKTSTPGCSYVFATYGEVFQEIH